MGKESTFPSVLSIKARRLLLRISLIAVRASSEREKRAAVSFALKPSSELSASGEGKVRERRRDEERGKGVHKRRGGGRREEGGNEMKKERMRRENTSSRAVVVDGGSEIIHRRLYSLHSPLNKPQP